MTAHRNTAALNTKSRSHDVRPLGQDCYEVISGTSGQTYIVNLANTTCTCPWGHHNPDTACSHILAARKWLARFEGVGGVGVWTTSQAALKQNCAVEQVGDIFITLPLKPSASAARPQLPGMVAALTQDDTQPKAPARKAACKRNQRAAIILAGIRRQYDELNATLAHSAERPHISGPRDVRDLVSPALESLTHEELWVVLLDVRNRVKKLVRLYVGNVNTNIIRMGEIFNAAIIENAPSIIIVHNHPSGDASPSPEDVAVTRAAVEAGRLLDIDLMDHVVIGRDSYVSLKERGLGF